MKKTVQDHSLRQFLKLGFVVAAAGLIPFPVLAALRDNVTRERSLALYNTHTGESIKTVFWAEGSYIPPALAEINYVLRDHRNNEIKDISPMLLDLLCDINRMVDGRQPFQIISGYRSPTTNKKLAALSDGVAKHSMHLDGKAIDIRVPGRELVQVRRAALMLQGGGVGYYPKSDFVHVDVGRIRQWQG
jgi:uncharacterized protein YcbK (DUF882 family)